MTHQLERLRQAIIDNTHGDLFWVGEILLSELEKETGYNGKSPKVQKDADAPCEYCGPEFEPDCPGNACENCMNTGLKYPAVSAGQSGAPTESK